MKHDKAISQLFTVLFSSVDVYLTTPVTLFNIPSVTCAIKNPDLQRQMFKLLSLMNVIHLLYAKYTLDVFA